MWHAGRRVGGISGIGGVGGQHDGMIISRGGRAYVRTYIRTGRALALLVLIGCAALHCASYTVVACVWYIMYMYVLVA